MIEQVRQDLQEFTQVTQKTQRQLSKEIGLSTAVISQFLNGIYSGDNEEVAVTINRYLTVGKQRLNSVRSWVFYDKLYNTKQVLEAASYAHRNNDIALVCGDAGAGKTTALEHYRDTNANVVLITADSCCTSASAILNRLCRAVNIPPTGNREAMMEKLIRLLVDTNRLIIIDEADHLSLRALQAIRNLNDQAHVGIVLSGNEKIYHQMKYGRQSSQFQQLRTRILVRKWVRNDYTVEEINAIFPHLTSKSAAQLLALANAESLRTARKLYDIALENALHRGETLNEKHLITTRKQLLGEAI